MGDTIELSTRNFVEITSGFYKVSTNAVTFEVKGQGPAFVGLACEPGRDVKYWIGIEDNRRILMVDGLDRDLRESWVISDEPESTLNAEAFTKLWISWHSGRLRSGNGSNIEKALINEPRDHLINYVTFVSDGPCDWKIEVPPMSLVKMARQPKVTMPVTGGQPEWVKTNGQLPDDSIIGGNENGELLYIIRGHHRRSLTPGKFVPSEGVAYICWGGETHVMEEFEVLQGYNFQWTRTKTCEIPKNALIAGHSEDGDSLYIGRAYHKRQLIVGKVQPTHKVCYLPYRGKEIAVEEYEILTVPGLNEHIATDHFVNDLLGSIPSYYSILHGYQ